MKIIEPTFEILNPQDLLDGIAKLQFIEKMARISHRSEDLQTDDSYKRFIKFVVMEKGDWSVVEHAYATVIFRVDRGVTHELVRHRLFSFTQESTRFVNYGKKGDMDFIVQWESMQMIPTSSWPIKVPKRNILHSFQLGDRHKLHGLCYLMVLPPQSQ